MFLKSLRLTNLLSFGESTEALELRPLNVLIGPNGSGKSNLIEAIDLLRSAPGKLLQPIREGGGVHDWLWKGTHRPVASLEAVLDYGRGPRDLRYLLRFTEVGQRFEVVDERIESDQIDAYQTLPNLYYRYSDGQGVLNTKGGTQRTLQLEDIDLTASILAQRKDPDQYPELTYVGEMFSKIQLYREWSFGRRTPARLPQKTDLPNDFLEPDCSNLALVLNRLGRDPDVKTRLLEALRVLYEGIEDFSTQIEGGTVQVFLQEGRVAIPATRLSDGTLRYLCMLAILCHPNPPPLLCIEEPELGLHPDVLPALATLLKDASSRSQIIVTTHSDVLVDAMSDMPESVVVAEKTPLGTTLTRLNAEKLKPWLEEYRLGHLWTRGDIGGTRW